MSTKLSGIAGFGKGWVYTLTIWAYPGHEKFQQFSAVVTAALAQDVRGDYFVEDASKEIFWTHWQGADDGSDALLMLLNTDWTSKNNVKTATIHTPDWAFEIDIPERDMRFVRIYGDKAIVSDTSLYIRKNADGRLMAYGSGTVTCLVYAGSEVEERVLDFDCNTEMEITL